MAKALIECTCKVCGELFYKSCIKQSVAEAEKWKEWATGKFDICPSCERQENLELAQRKTRDYPTLHGSLKQVNWATRIRYAFVRSKIFLSPKVKDCILDDCKEAKWWIENRYSVFTENPDEALCRAIRRSNTSFDKELWEKLQSIAKTR